MMNCSVHDGWGIAPEKGLKGDAIEAADTTNMDTIAEKHSYRTLLAHGNAVGLNDGLMGNSEVGCILHQHASPMCRVTQLRPTGTSTSAQAALCGKILSG